MPSWTRGTRPRHVGSLAARALALYAMMLAAAVITGCGGGGDTTVQPSLSVELAGAGQGTVTGTSGGLNCSNAGGAAAGPTCRATVPEGTDVTLTATPADGSAFTGWGGTGVSCAANAPCLVTVTESRTVTAAFEPSTGPQTLTVTGAGTGSGVVVSDPAGINCTITAGAAGGSGCTADFPIGTSVELQVQSGTLVGFGGACSGISCSLTMSQPRAVIVTFPASNTMSTRLLSSSVMIAACRTRDRNASVGSGTFFVASLRVFAKMSRYGGNFPCNSDV